MSLSCGNRFTLVQDFSNRLYSCGTNLKGELGTDSQTDKCPTFEKVSSSKGMGIITKMECADFVCALDSYGDVYVWGPTPLGEFT